MIVYHVLEERDDITKVIATRGILGALCNIVGRKTVNRIDLKVDGDPIIEADFGEVVRIQYEYWKRKKDLLADYIGQYEDQIIIQYHLLC